MPYGCDPAAAHRRPHGMRLIGALSNPDALAALRRLDRIRTKRLAEATRVPRPDRGGEAAMRSDPSGGARRARRLVGGHAPSEIHTRVEQRLGCSVVRDTVTSFLSVACRDEESPVIRVQRGLYAATDGPRLAPIGYISPAIAGRGGSSVQRIVGAFRKPIGPAFKGCVTWTDPRLYTATCGTCTTLRVAPFHCNPFATRSSQRSSPSSARSTRPPRTP